jgi:recombinational DNA repair ATPase RecF
MLAMKLAVADFLAGINGKDVILILDEVFAELDSGKSRALMKVLMGYGQVFIATAGDLQFAGANYKMFFVENGNIEERAV